MEVTSLPLTVATTTLAPVVAAPVKTALKDCRTVPVAAADLINVVAPGDLRNVVAPKCWSSIAPGAWRLEQQDCTCRQE